MYLSIKRKKKGNYYILGKFGGGQPQPIDYSKMPMFFENVDDKEIEISIKKSNNSAYTATFETSYDNINWEDWGSTSTTTLTKSVPFGGKLYVRSTENVGYVNKGTSSYYNYFSSTGGVNVGGNLQSLAYKDFEDAVLNKGSYKFHSLFKGMLYLQNARNLKLTQMKLGAYQYYNMFSGCTSLTTAPELPATELAESCYSYMFWGCTSLTKAPALPATTLKEYCYGSMFSGCSSLTAAPSLPATKLVRECYRGMFMDCTSLTEAPSLPATIVVYMSYYYMFKGCTNLNKIVTYANGISATDCLYKWLDGVSNTGDFYNLGGATYPSGTSGIPTGWTEHTTLE